MPKRTIPRWLELQEEIDYLYLALGQHHQHMPTSALDAMIDEATGAGRERVKSIRAIAQRMKELKAALSKETGERYSMAMEEALLALPEAAWNSQSSRSLHGP